MINIKAYEQLMQKESDDMPTWRENKKYRAKEKLMKEIKEKMAKGEIKYFQENFEFKVTPKTVYIVDLMYVDNNDKAHYIKFLKFKESKYYERIRKDAENKYGFKVDFLMAK